MSQVVIKLISFLFSSDVSSYYQDIYRKKFCLSSNQVTNTTIKTEKLSWNEQTDMGYSSQQQNFGIDFEELEGEFRSCVPKEQATDCQNNEKQLFLEKENKGYGTDKNSLLCKSHNSKSNFQRYVSTTAHNVTSLGDKRQLSGSLFGTIQKSCYSNCSADIDRKTHSGTSFRDHYSKSVLIGRANCKDVNPVSLSGEVQIFEKVQNTSLPNLGASIHGPNELTNKSTVSQFDDVSTNEENMQSSSQSLFSQDELGHKEESKFSVDCVSNVQKNGIAVPVKENERTPYAIAPNSVTSISSKIARRLYQHKQKRQGDQKAETECSNVNNGKNIYFKTF